MARWVWWAVARIRTLGVTGRVRFTHKPLEELYRLDLGLDESDAADVLALLAPSEVAGRVRSSRTGEWMYVLGPGVGAIPLYVKVILRDECVVISFHAREGDDEEDLA